ncbi:hypothetical protein GH740_06215 [Microbacterium sp. SYP-A9085]|uniref:hypothetical protein n=1 Tax=Microbacterium sp. SYP-A9085 TaxID=2664454 RepID=UPI00129B8A16|nr:hypothetical protein [Microbacterium sp. SYP-A9085]MRH28908.1 hypothetical protein [Microbacterium sp. SYP-A9085]
MSGITVQLLGGELVSMIDLNVDRRFSVVSRVFDASPLSLGATPDPFLRSRLESGKGTVGARLDLSKDVRGALRAAHADVLVIDTTLALRELLQVGESLSTALAADVAPWLEEHSGLRRIRPQELGRDELERTLIPGFDRFVDAVLDVYPAQRIILLRSHCSRLYWDGRTVQARSALDDIRRAGDLLDRLDRRFAERTGCRVLTLAEDFLPTADGSQPSVRLGWDFHIAVEAAIVAACGGTVEPSTLGPRDQAFQDWASRLLSRRQKPKRRELQRLVREGAVRTPADAFALAALAIAYPKVDWQAVAHEVVAAGGELVLRTAARVEANREALDRHPFTEVPPSAASAAARRVVVRVADGHDVTIDPRRPVPIEVRRVGRDPEWDPQRFVDRGYVATLADIDDALESWFAYFERGRTGAREPFRLEFSGADEFVDSLDRLDYIDILANENYVVGMHGTAVPDPGWSARVDAGFLFDAKARVCCLRSGFGDQLFYYVYCREFADQMDLRLYVDDLLFDNDEMLAHTPHMRPDVLPFTRSDGVFSEIFSRRLREARKRDITVRRDNRSEYHALGLTEMILATDRMHLKASLDRRDFPSCLTVQVIDLEGYERLIAAPPGVLFMDVLAKEGLLKYHLMTKKALWEDAIHLPPLVNDDSRRVEQQMLATDAVVVHIRRGDRVSLGIADSDAYYRDFVLRTAQLDEFADKHWFVFSDDLDYCRAHAVELGLDVAGDRLTYVEGNHHFASTDDFHLMALGKVVVCGKSGFSACAAMVSTRVEHIFGTGYSLEPGGDAWHRATAGAPTPVLAKG